ncbi:DUF938 domain-containing protein [Novosphingobium sp. BW1]|uniref:DUF938 domain-containing protein n=1 Tax=Novosphingobium sp. BW1 TaxID=2592621 RepID=UPI0011DEA9D6|nr:DUF938 domain-containing protein [Novosphingobium sp. BW1]TYC94746.1 DUF938 domain-containing protein [Novosphingobium sp. BW1]
MSYTTPLDSGSPDPRRHAPATLRNRAPILTLLREELPESGLVLEVASGSGEHAVHFAAGLPGLVWQPSDPDSKACASIAAWGAQESLSNLCAPMMLDAAQPAQWPVSRADAMVCINMVHISPWSATQGLFIGAAGRLNAGAPLVLYGPYREADVEIAPSNLEFDQSLKVRNPAWGLRELFDVDALATNSGFVRSRRVEMPANNLLLVYRRAEAR